MARQHLYSTRQVVKSLGPETQAAYRALARDRRREWRRQLWRALTRSTPAFRGDDDA